jgi:hypothetical protein
MSEHQIFTKCAWQLIPFAMLLYIVNFVDRTNVGFAALTMNKDLGFSPFISSSVISFSRCPPISCFSES